MNENQNKGISVENLTLSYEKNLVLNNINFSIKKGSVVTLVGPNGCGKTTLLKIINGFLRQNEGTVYIDSRNIEEIANRELARILGHVSQMHKSSFPFSVLDVVLTGRMPYISMFSTPGKEDIEKAYQVLEFMGMAHFARRPYTRISGGERQMVMIAKALVQEPDFLLLDEPTSFLDLKNQIHVLKTIISLAKTRNITVLMTLHEPNHALLFSDEIILLRKLHSPENENYSSRHDPSPGASPEKEDIPAFPEENIVSSGAPEKVMTPEKIKEAYGIDVEVLEHKGKRMIVPEI
ncbi:Iron(III) ABC transporter, ATP-binding protein [Methanosarcina siciliae T4/M]|uniref:Cobalamin import ATP-binding protein BtuD n=2 Tax=Methanosarcina siciliae TaxID=38027 RepID=A0A0E3L9R5_9EURY|nr:ABC transporter ATP-binding protein [Methanosarcina siciliae]AKB26760.1 Iron(III) ABC transporter, ATP-binding protein [Methanosarcina siciliae T4/M]AKB30731.1 Iron(III) ABC transporter, ATP-binding protein [Methanosarcina siciliae HI350]